MKFALALVGAAAATTETGIKMLQKLNSMDQSIENMQNVKVALVQCAAAGDCSQEAAAMPTLAMDAEASTEATTDSTAATTASTDSTTTADATATTTTAKQTDVEKWESCYKTNGSDAKAADTCAKEKAAAFKGDEVKYLTAKVQATCVTKKATLTGLNDKKDGLATHATTEEKADYVAWEASCKLDKAALAATKDGAMPWIIVGGVVGLVCLVGGICYCQKNKSEEDN